MLHDCHGVIRLKLPWNKPKGLHWATYNRLLDQPDELDEMGWGYVVGGLVGRNG